MKPQHLLLLVPTAMAYSLSGGKSRPSFVGKPESALKAESAVLMEATSRSKNLWKAPKFQEHMTILDDAEIDQETTPSVSQEYRILALEQAEARHGMPWKESIDASYTDEELLYMPFWEWQMDFMKEHLTNLKVEACHNGETDFSYNENTQKKARIVNVCASSDEYRKIRMTYYDAGDNTQVFNAVWYPDPAYNLPVLGIDLLAFNRKKYLAIVDFQPLHEDESDHATTYEDKLKPIREKYETLKGRMSSKFYDETQFFSQQMLFARFDQEQVVQDELFPAFQRYVQTHLDLVRSTTPEPKASSFVLGRQKEYDTYSAERDPATGLFAAMYGKEWADDFVHDFLFSMSDRPSEEDEAATPAPQHQAPQQRQGSSLRP